MVYAVDRDSGSLRGVSPTAYAYDQTRALNAQYVPRGWMELPSWSSSSVLLIYNDVEMI